MSHTAIFIDGPLVGSMKALPDGIRTWEVQQFDTDFQFGPFDIDAKPVAMWQKTVTYRPVMVGVASTVGFWAIGDDIPALSSFIELIWPVLKLAEEVAHMELRP